MRKNKETITKLSRKEGRKEGRKEERKKEVTFS